MFNSNIEHSEKILKKMRDYSPAEYDKRTKEMRKKYKQSFAQSGQPLKTQKEKMAHKMKDAKNKAIEKKTEGKESYSKKYGSYYRLHGKELEFYPEKKGGGYDKSSGGTVDWGNIEKSEHPYLRKIYKKLGGNPNHINYRKQTVGPGDYNK